jgi:hypothetical protein
VRTPISLLFLLVLLGSTFSITAQHSNTHNLFWVGLTVSDAINSKLKWEVSVQRRSQNPADSKSKLFESLQYSSYSVSLQYRVNTHFKISVSPFGYYKSWLLNVVPADEELAPIREYRWWGKLDYETKSRFFNYLNRYSFEFRNRDLERNNDYQPGWRMRYMTRVERAVGAQLRKPVTFVLYDEIFVRMDRRHAFDQNRLYGGLYYEVLPHMKTTLGFMYGIQDRNFGEAVDHVRTIFVGLSFDNVCSRIAKRIKPAKTTTSRAVPGVHHAFAGKRA